MDPLETSDKITFLCMSDLKPKHVRWYGFQILE